jgi:mannosyltransferase
VRSAVPLRRFALPAAVVLAVGLAAALASRAIRLAPLNVDEELTRRVATEPFGSIFHIVSSERGGGPLHFWIEHFTLQWPGGLVGLRGPSTLFFLLTLPAVALIARELAGSFAAVAAVLLTATAPLAISYSTFGRPHALLLAFIEWGTWVGLRAARSGSRRGWFLAGVILGSSVFVHPTAPVYSLTAFAGALVYAPRSPRAVAREAWPGLVALTVTFVPYYLKTLHVLSERYGVGSGARGRTFSGRSVWMDAVHAVAPVPHLLNWFTAFALGGLLALVLTRGWRAATVPVLAAGLPVLFFTLVPTKGLSALFFDRYMLPALPSFLLLVAVGCATVAGWAGRARWVVLAILLVGLMTLETRVVLARQRQLSHLELGRIAALVEKDGRGDVVFGTTGSEDTTGYLGAFNFGRPPNLLDRYLELRVPSMTLVDDDTCIPVVSFLATPSAPRNGIWIFYAARPDEEALARPALEAVPGVVVADPAPRYIVARSKAALPPRQLVELGLELRRRWQRLVPGNPRVIDLVDGDSQALRDPASCKGHGFLDDPDISPNWPESLN